MPILLKRLVYLLLIQILIYSFFTEWSIAILDNVSINYYLQFIVFVFLFIPLLSLTFFKTKTIKYDFKIKNVLPFLILYIFLPILHFLILIKYEIFNRRIGTQTIALVYGDMNGFDKFLMRIYDFSQFAFIIICYFTLKNLKSFKHRTLFKIVFYFNFAYIILFSLFNSRASLIVLFLLIFIIDGLFNHIAKRTKKILIIFGLLFFIIASSIRYIPLIIVSDVDIKDILKNEFLYRANCSKFFNEVYDATNNKGLLYGETITTPFLSLKAIFGSEIAKEKIRNAETGSKQYILSNFLQKDNKDDCSCAVVDPYVNFGFTGIIILTLLYFFWIFVIYKLIHLHTIKTYQLALIIFLTSSIMLYEIDGFSLLFSFVKFVPVLFLYFILNPVILKRVNIEKQ
jgi:oligosaccharide repeat unit polymerase